MPPSARPFFAKILPACAMASKCIRSSPRLQQRIRFQRKGVETTGLAAESTARLEQLLELETRQRGQYCWLPLWAISYVHTVQSCWCWLDGHMDAFVVVDAWLLVETGYALHGVAKWGLEH
jgi:hypothetical protein